MSNDTDANDERTGGVLIIYTGGTIGCAPRDANDPESPLSVLRADKFVEGVPAIHAMKDDFRLDVHEIYPPLDSTEMMPENWIEIAKVIEENYEQYDGFVILHGTDTMVYTASALSFMMPNLRKPVIITGSQLPIIGNSRSDGTLNLVNSIRVANSKKFNLPLIPEVVILFDKYILRGSRAKKVSASGFAGFESPNFPPLGKIGEHIEINPDLLQKRADKTFQVQYDLDTRVIPLLVYPGLADSEFLKATVKVKDTSGLILLAYGTGNVPTNDSFLHAIDRAREDKQIIADVTQCHQGTVELGAYETSAVLLERGVVSGSDITPEAALCKLMILLGNEDKSRDQVRIDFQKDLVGEQSRSIYTFKMSEELESISSNDDTKKRWRKNIDSVGSEWTDRVEKASLRLYNAALEVPDSDDGDEAVLKLSCFIGIKSTDKLDYDSPNYCGSFRRSKSDFTSMVILDVTNVFRNLIDHNSAASFTIVIENESSGYTLKWDVAELAIFTNSGVR